MVDRTNISKRNSPSLIPEAILKYWTMLTECSFRQCRFASDKVLLIRILPQIVHLKMDPFLRRTLRSFSCNTLGSIFRAGFGVEATRRSS